MKTVKEETLDAEMEAIIKTCVKEACDAHPLENPEDKVKLEAALRSYASGNEPIYKALGISDKLMEQYYALAYRLYKMGNYKDSLTVFMNLYPKDGFNPRYTFGIAACHHQLKDYEQAANFYMLTCYLNKEDPISALHMYDCYMKMEDHWAAAYALGMVLSRTENNPNYPSMHKDARLRMDKIKEIIAEEKTKQKKLNLIY